MEPILTREEISDLMAAVKAGRVSVDFPDGRAATADARSIDLFHHAAWHYRGGEARIPNLDIVLDGFARRFSTSLANALQRGFTVERDSIMACTFEQSLQELKDQGAAGVYTIAPLKHGCLLHVDALMAFALLEIMLGSSQSGESMALDRQLTTIEMAILRTILEAACQDMEQAMRPVATLQARLTKMENNFRLLHIVEPEAEVLATVFRLQLGREQCGTIRFIIPYLTLEPFRDKFKSLSAVTQSTGANWTQNLTRELMQMECTVTARSGLLNMSISSILGMQAGDLIDLPYNPEQPLLITAGDQPLFLAIAGERDGRKAVHVTGPHSPLSAGGIHGNT